MWAIPTIACYSAFKEKKVLSCATMWMTPKDNMLSEISQRLILPGITNMWNLNKGKREKSNSYNGE